MTDGSYNVDETHSTAPSSGIAHPDTYRFHSDTPQFLYPGTGHPSGMEILIGQLNLTSIQANN